MTRSEADGRRVAVVIASAGRPEMLEHLISILRQQTLEPGEIHVVVPTSASLPGTPIDSTPGDTVQVGPSGAARQRNAGVDALSEEAEFVFFFDDDAIPRRDFIARSVQVFDENPDVVGLTGKVVVDGARLGRQVSASEAMRALALSEHDDGGTQPVPTRGLYGCNFAVRARALGSVRFDDRLPLYSWLEDLDFSRRLARTGRLVVAPSCVAAHLGSASGGRLQHERFGYSQIANPAYLWRKGSLDLRDLARLIGKPVVSNLVRSVAAGATSRAWRRQRLRGNRRAVADIFRGRMAPERILTIE